MPQHTDHAGVMWHGAYLSWLEEARIEALAQVGLPYSDLSDDGFELPVVSIEINFVNPLLHGQSVLIESVALPRKGVRWSWVTKFLRDGKIVTQAKVDLVLVEKFGREHRLVRHVPNQISSYLLRLQNGPSS